MRGLQSFSAGVFNTWLLSFLSLLVMYVPLFFISPDKIRRQGRFPVGSPVEKLVLGLFLLVYLGVLLIPVWVPFAEGAWLIGGSVLYGFGLGLWVLSFRDYMHTPATELVTTGIYSRSRNPMYLGETLTFLGMAIAGASWPLILLVFLYGLLSILLVKGEERMLQAEFGQRYEAYCQKVRRWF